MLCVLVPFVSFVNFAHLRLSAGGGEGIVLAYAAIAVAGAAAFMIGRRGLQLPPARLGAVILTVAIVNTGYLGL
jgi:predicted permease